jgi:PAS domain S-box-containing protein
MTTKDAPALENSGVPHPTDSTPPAAPHTDVPINILLVDDEPKNLTVLETILADPGYRLVRAESANQALLALVAEEFALLVLDIHMPEMNGFELAKMIKQRKKTANIPIIFLTAYYSEDQYVLEGYQTGAVDYLHKPVNPTILRSKVAVFAELYRKTRENAHANRTLLAEVAERKRAQEQLVQLNNELESRVNDRTSDLLRANRALRESEQRLDLALKGADLGVWDWNVQTGAVRYDARWAQMLGYTTAEITGDYDFWRESIHPDDLPRVQAALDAHLSRQSADYRVAHRLRHKDGRWIWVLSCGRVVERDENGRPLRACGTHLDVTAQKQAEESLRRSEAFARSVVESSADCVQVFALDGRLEWMNENARRRPEAREPGAAPVRDWKSFAEAGGVPAEAEAALEAARATGIGRFRGLWPAEGGRSRWWDVAVTPIAGPDGTPERFLSVSRDVTEQCEAEEALKDAARQKDEFLAMLSHELRNPLAPIRNSVEVLRMIGSQDSTQTAAREMIDRQVTHMARLVDDLLDVSRVSRGKIQLQKKPLDLARVVQQAAETTRQLVATRRHELTVKLPEEPVRVEGDFTRLAQVLVNLLDNAAKYTDRGGKIWLTLEGTSSEAVLRVCDTGRGIEPSAQKHLFDLFYQGDRDLDRSEGGLGIGLSLARSLVLMHGGTVEAHSAGRGRGSEFVVRLPRLRGAAGESHSGVNDVPARPSRALRVLVVDDNGDSAESMAVILRIDGHEVFTAYDGKKAVEVSLRERPDVVLLDLGLPGLNGYQACEAMRSGGLAETLIVAMTGYGQKEDRRRAHEAGFDEFQVKPVAMLAIRELLVKQAERSRARATL